jgi:hypothetical protein
MYKDILIKKVLFKNDLQPTNNNNHGFIGKSRNDQNSKERNTKGMVNEGRSATLSSGIFQRK